MPLAFCVRQTLILWDVSRFEERNIIDLSRGIPQADRTTADLMHDPAVGVLGILCHSRRQDGMMHNAVARRVVRGDEDVS